MIIPSHTDLPKKSTQQNPLLGQGDGGKKALFTLNDQR